jgi:NAD(P)-dependent dehydrogenase (short-subunit alcohol dehydrogenase family)
MPSLLTTLLLIPLLAASLFYLHPTPTRQTNDEIISFTSSTYPISDTTVLITGVTSGIGLELATTLLSLGATVLGTGRSSSKLAALAATTFSSTPGNFIPLLVDHSDLQQVASLIQDLPSLTSHIDILVNNAGIHNGPAFTAISADNRSPSNGMDKLFVTNYLSHVSLTDGVMPLLKASNHPNPRVVQVTSSYHWISDGHHLRPVSGFIPPYASRGTDKSKLWRVAHLSYGDSKLAQILHMHSLNEEFQSSDDTRHMSALAFCPAWVATSFAPEPGQKIVKLLGHSPQAGIRGLLHAALHPAMKPGDFVGNTDIVNRVPYKEKWLAGGWNILGYPIRDDLTDVLAMVMMLLQRFSYGQFLQQGSPETRDVELRDELMVWSRETLKQFS